MDAWPAVYHISNINATFFLYVVVRALAQGSMIYANQWKKDKMVYGLIVRIVASL